MYIPHLGGQIIEEVDEHDSTGSISGNSITENSSNLNVRTETTKLAKSWPDWKTYQYYPDQEKQNKSILIIGRFDSARWKKGGVLYSCKQLSKHLQNGGFTVSEREIDSPVNEITKQMTSGQYDLIITYTGDYNAQDYFPMTQIVKCSKEIATPTIFNLSYDRHPKRILQIQKTLEQTKDSDALMVFTSEAKTEISCKIDINNCVVIPKTVSIWEPNSAVYSETNGIFLGDVVKFSNERLNPNHIEIYKALLKEFPGVQLFFVAQYEAKNIPEIIVNNSKIIPYSDDIHEIINQCRVYVHTPNHCTFEMLPVEAMTSGVPICYRDMPQSLNQYIGDSGLKFESIDSMLIAIRKIYFSEENWSRFRTSGIQRGLTLSEKQITVHLTLAIESFLSTNHLK
jgi:glycosyltransferase involved in cell wall biosynthesis